jgi:hypothetical protein
MNILAVEAEEHIVVAGHMFLCIKLIPDREHHMRSSTSREFKAVES